MSPLLVAIWHYGVSPDIAICNISSVTSWPFYGSCTVGCCVPSWNQNYHNPSGNPTREVYFWHFKRGGATYLRIKMLCDEEKSHTASMDYLLERLFCETETTYLYKGDISIHCMWQNRHYLKNNVMIIRQTQWVLQEMSGCYFILNLDLDNLSRIAICT